MNFTLSERAEDRFSPVAVDMLYNLLTFYGKLLQIHHLLGASQQVRFQQSDVCLGNDNIPQDVCN